jgi:hypothetical protein
METYSRIKKPRDLSKIGSSDMDELLWWSMQLSISPEKLLAITGKYGNSAEFVKRIVSESKGQPFQTDQKP